MTGYTTVCTPSLDDAAALTQALEAHRRRRPRDGRERVFIPSSWRVETVPCRSYVLAAPRPWWEWARAWRP